jgi:hypothetical protein
MKSIKEQIIEYLETCPGWVFGGVLEDYIRRSNGHKASNASRRCRELTNEGKIERRLVVHEGLRVVQYRTPVPVEQKVLF